MRFRTLSITAVLCCVAAAFAGGCMVSAWSGMAGATLVRAEYPRMALAAKEPLTLQAYGRQWVSLPTDYLGHKPTGFMDYAVYGEGEEGPVTRHAHVAIVRPSNDNYWEFKPESYPVPGGFAIGRAVIGNKSWTAQLVRVDGERDWFSAMWQASGRDVPEFWLSRRFSATPERATRVIAEYREPWPECLDPAVRDVTFVRAECLDGFLRRAEAAFDFEQEIPTESPGPSGPSVLVKPHFPPDMLRLAGELMENLRLQLWR
ncbi:MAG: hypothetical protein DELT_01771 [Desulfovibrio sp.]